MKFKIEVWSIAQLIDLYEAGKIDLKPPYQRGDIWTAPAKRKLIDSIKSFYPLPAFFMYQKPDHLFEMVDGQQRTRAILGYHNDFFTDENSQSINQTNKQTFYHDYKISITIITEAEKGKIEDFYYRVNKFGSKLNRPEMLKSQHFSKPQQKLIERLSDKELFKELELFTLTSLNRLNDQDLLGELLTLELVGITDKKTQVDKSFFENEQLNEQQLRDLEENFNIVLGHLQRFNEIYPIKNTRYKQRNDIYTLYSFLKDKSELGTELLDYFYKELVLIGEDISPSNEKCFPLKEYADNCVSQSNSKRSRDARLAFLNSFLLNEDPDPIGKDEEDPDINIVMYDLMHFYNLDKQDLIKKDNLFLIDLNKLQKATSRSYFA